MSDAAQIDVFGLHDWSWNLPEFGDPASDGSGRPGIGVVGQAIQTWMMLNGAPTTLGQIAAAFNLPVRMVEQVVADDGNWLWRDGDSVGLDGA